MVHFVRFEFDGTGRKISHEIGGSTTLRIKDCVYALTGVLVHNGSPTSGHYYCDVVCPPHEQTGLAYQCNDAVYPSLIEEELGPDFKVAYMHIYELVTGDEAAPVANTLGSDTRKRRSGEKMTMTAATTAEKQQRRSGLQVNVEEQGLPATNVEQQRGRGLPANEEARNGKLIGNCRGSIPSTVESCTEEDEGWRRLKGWVEEKRRIHSMKPAERSKEKERRAKWLTAKIKEVKDDYPDIDTTMPSKAKAGAERKVTHRGGQSEAEKENVKVKDRTRKEASRLEQSEEEKAAENEAAKKRMAEQRKRQSEEEKKQRCATEKKRLEEKRQEQSVEEREQEKMQDRQRKTAKRANVASKPRDGLNAQMTLAGSFRVDTNHLGAMDEVS